MQAERGAGLRSVDRAAVDSASVGSAAAGPRRSAAARALARIAADQLPASVPPLLLVGDAAAFALAVALTYRRNVLAVPFGMLALAALTAVMFRSAGLYRHRLHLSALDDLPALVTRSFTAAGVAALADAALGRHALGWSLLRTAAAFSVLVVVARAGCYALVRAVRRRRLVAHRALVIGAGHVGSRLVRTFLTHPEYGLLPVGIYDPKPLFGHGQPVPVLREGTLGDAIVDTQAAVVVVAFSSDSESEIVNIVRSCDRMRREIFLVPRLFEVHSVSRGVDSAWGIPLIRLRRPALSRGRSGAKRAFDAVTAAVALLLLAPLMAVIAVAVRVDGGGGVLYGQDRIGRGGRTFRLWKFRTMPGWASSDGATRWSVADDPRVSRLGRFLRRTSLDELPQLWNVLVGDMSLVGPRPERPFFVDEFSGRYPRYLDRHRAPAGLTGLAQVSGLRGDTSIEDRARLDNAYIESWTLWGDLKILLRTLGAVARRSGA